MIQEQRFESLKRLIIALAVFVMSAQCVNLFYLKAFWLDEWIMLMNVKAIFEISPYQLFGSEVLSWGMDFPRGHLILLRFITKLGEYSNFSLRILSTLVSCFAVFFAAYFSLRYFRNRLLALVFFLAIVCNKFTVYYFTQMRIYPMEHFFAWVAIFQFWIYSKVRSENRNYSVGETLFLLFGLITGPFLTVSYAIVASPLILFMSSDLVFKRSKKIDFAFVLAFVVTSAVVFFKHYIVLLNSNYNAVKGYTGQKFDYSNIPQSIFLYFETFAYPYFGPEKEYGNFVAALKNVVMGLIALITISGIGFTFKRAFQTVKSKKISDSTFLFGFDHYFSVLLLVVTALYLVRFVPLGTYRGVYFFLPAIAFFFVTALQTYWESRTALVNYFARAVVGGFVVYGLVFLAYKYSNEIRHKNAWFDQGMWDNFGLALTQAYSVAEKPEIYVSRQLEPKFVRSNGFRVENVEIAMMSHPYYLLSNPVKMTFLNEAEICPAISKEKLEKVVVVDTESNPRLAAEYCGNRS